MVGDDFEAGRHGGDQVRGTKYEVRSVKVRRNGVVRVEREDAKREEAWGVYPCGRGVDAPSVCRAPVTREVSIAAFSKNFLGTGVWRVRLGMVFGLARDTDGVVECGRASDRI